MGALTTPNSALPTYANVWCKNGQSGKINGTIPEIPDWKVSGVSVLTGVTTVTSSYEDSLNMLESKIGNIVYEASINDYTKPNIKVIDTVTDIFKLLTTKNISIKSYTPIEEGGVSIEIQNDSSYYNISINNDLEATFYKEVKDQTPQGWDLTFKQVLSKLSGEF